jgi:hypothetical protein
MSLTRLDSRIVRLEQRLDATHGFPPWTPKQWSQWTDRERVEAFHQLPLPRGTLDTEARTARKACLASLSDMGLHCLISTWQTARGNTP